MLPLLLSSLLLLLSLLPSPTLSSTSSPLAPPMIREPGRCTMYDECGSKSTFSGKLPCPDNGLARKSEDPAFLGMLRGLCGDDWGDTTCCTQNQLNTLASSLAQAEPLIATCPACRNNFIQFYCQFTCSPSQSLFLTVLSTQPTKPNLTAISTVSVSVSPLLGQSFFSSCADVKFGATNGYAMDLLGGGARDWLSFLRFMGKERFGGSPFGIEYRDPDEGEEEGGRALEFVGKRCDGTGLDERCACPDCPGVCTKLPEVKKEGRGCKVGRMSCFSFSLVIIYAGCLVGFSVVVVGKGVLSGGKSWRLRWPEWSGVGGREGYDRLPLEDPLLSTDSAEDGGSLPSRSGSASRPLGGGGSSLIGATSTSNAFDGESRPSVRTSSTSRFDPSSSSSTLSPNPFLQPRTYFLNTLLSRSFYHLGLFCATKPFLTIALGLGIAGVINGGWSAFEVERDPVRLWVGKGSESEIGKRVFEENFGPFFRTEQVFVSGVVGGRRRGEGLEEGGLVWDPADEPVLSWERLKWWARVEDSIKGLVSPSGVRFRDICFSPATDPLVPESDEECVVQSVMGYFGNSLKGVDEDSWKSRLDDCVGTPVGCLPSFGMPLNPKLVLGGGVGSEARSLIVTFVVRNSLDPKKVERAEEWENTLKEFLEEISTKVNPELGVEISWSTGISLEEELNKSSNTDIPVVAASYLLMFFYVSVNLGSSGAGLLKSLGRGGTLIVQTIVGGVMMILPKKIGGGRQRSESVTFSLAGSSPGLGPYFRRQVLVDSKFVLGLWGILIVLLSVSTSVALFSALHIKVTLIIAEVIPFLVLAIGVDNVFILSHELDQQNSRSYALASRQTGGGGGIQDYEEEEENGALPSAEDRIARTLGRIGPSILLSAACETVAFSLGALVGMPAVRNFAIYAAGAVVINAALQVTVFVSAMAIDLRRVESNRVDCFPCFKIPPTTSSMDLGAAASQGIVSKFIRVWYASALLKKPVKYLVLVLFSGFFVLSWIGSRHIKLGLDQRLALPSNSYLINYFNALDTFLEVGPPVYFVTKDIDPTTRANQQELCGRFSTCEQLSLANVLEAERKLPESSYLAEPPAVWLDDFFQWLNPLLEDCCRVRRRDPTQFCSPTDPDMMCRPCYEDAEPAWNITMNGLPEGEEFMRYLDQWLISPTDESCPLGGKAAYSTALKVEDGSVALSHFRTYHTPLKTQDDFINAMAAAQRIAKDISKRTGSTVYPYSLFYVFFDQYSHIVATTREVVSLALLAVFSVTSLLLGSWRTGAVVVFTVFLTVFSVMGAMGAWGISLNAISLVNIVISVGIAVEFCSHIARAFMGASGGGLPFDHPAGSRDRDERSWTALVEVGSSVLSGITLTKLIGISVLAFTRSKLLEVYFFRMWLVLIISGALHGLVFLPVALSFWGGQGYVLQNFDDESWMETVVSGRYEHEGRIFLGDDEEDSDVEDRF